MKSLTRLDSVVFQLTPTRTRCELVISANGKTEKLASGLLNPFLAHLKAAQDQMAKGGYSITLQPVSGTDASWFTKETMERFVRFVSTPEILERVHTLELEMLQIEEAIAIQNSNNTGLSVVEDHQSKPYESKEGNKIMPDTSEDKAIVLYTPSAHPPEANKTSVQEENSKVQLLKVLETRKTVLQKEQGMAFARAKAAGFDIDSMSPLKCFAGMFGAARLMEACSKFTELWKRKHETGEWLEIEAAEAVSVRSDLPNMNASGIVLVDKQKEFKEPWSESPENNGKDEKASPSQQPFAPQGYFQGQFPHPMYPPWPMHSPPGAMPGFQGYPIQGMPYYQNYPGNSSYFPQPYPTMEDQRHNSGRKGSRRHSLDSSDSHNESVTWEMEKARSSQDDPELENEHGQNEEGNRRSRSGKRSSGKVVIRNINYITSNRQPASGSDSESSSNSENGEEDQDLSLSSPNRKHGNAHRSSEKEGRLGKLLDVSNKGVNGREVDGGQWQAFQSFLLRDTEEGETEANKDMFSMEKEVQFKRKKNVMGEDPVASDERRKGQFESFDLADIHRLNAGMTRLPKASHDESLIPRRVSHPGIGRTYVDGETDLQSSNVNGRRLYRRALNDDFMIDGCENQNGVLTSPSDPMAVNGFERTSNGFERISSSHSINDESYIVPFRSISIAENGHYGRRAMDIDSEIPQVHQNGKDVANSQVNYEPDGLTLMPERGNEHGSGAYDPALDYEMQAHTEEKKNKETATNSKQAFKKLDKDQKLKGSPSSSERTKVGGPIRKGKTSKSSPLEDARARAEKLRSFKADLQKMKKEQEEAEKRRLEALKIERQKRIAAKGGSSPAQSPIFNLQTKKLPNKASPSSQKGSKFSDSEPGLSSPLQRSKVAMLSVGSADSQKKSKSSKLNGSQSSGHRLTRSVSSLPDQKKDAGDATPEKKASMARIRRLSEPRMSSSPHVSSVKVKSSEAPLKAKTRSVPDSKKITAIVNHDRSKIASLPELKIKTPKAAEVTRKRSVVDKMVKKDGEGESMAVTEPIRSKDHASSLGDLDDCTVVEKNVLILVDQKPSVPPLCLQEGANGLQKQQVSAHEIDKGTETTTNYAAIRAPVSPVDMEQPDTEQNKPTVHQKPRTHKLDIGNLNNTKNDLPNLSSSGADEKPYQAPYAKISSLEDPCTGKSEYGKAPPTSLLAAAKNTETVKAHVSDVRSLKLEKIPEAAAKLQIKESSKGLRKLLNFGKKNHSSAASDSRIRLDNDTLNGSEADESATNTAGSTEVHMLKNLISQDETSSAGTTPQKSSRHFSLFSTFRNKTSGEKKPTVS